MQSYLQILMTPNQELKELTERLMLMAPFYNIKVVSQPYNRTIVTNLRPDAKVETMVIYFMDGDIDLFLKNCRGEMVTDIENFEMGNSRHLNGVPVVSAVLDILRIMQL